MDEEVEDAKDAFRDAPAIEVVRTELLNDWEPGGGGAARGSPARSANVLRFPNVFPGRAIPVDRALVAEADRSDKCLPGVGMLLGGRIPETNCCVNSDYRLSGVSWTYRILMLVVHGSERS